MYSLYPLIVAVVLGGKTAPLLETQILTGYGGRRIAQAGDRYSQRLLGFAKTFFHQYFEVAEDQPPVAFEWVSVKLSAPPVDYPYYQEEKPKLDERDVYVTAVVRQLEGPDKRKEVQLTFTIPANSAWSYDDGNAKDVKFVTQDGDYADTMPAEKIARVAWRRKLTTILQYTVGIAAVVSLLVWLATRRVSTDFVVNESTRPTSKTDDVVRDDWPRGGPTDRDVR